MSVPSKTSAGDIPDIPDTSVLSVRAAKRAQQAKHKRIVFLAVVFLFLVLLALSIYRIVTLNIKYPSPQTYVFSMGQEILSGDIGITVTGLTVYEGKEIYTVIPEDLIREADREWIDLGKMRVLVCDVTYKNYSEEHYRFPTLFSMQIGFSYASSSDFEFFNSINSKTDPPFYILAPGEEVTIRMPYSMWYSSTLEDIWESILGEQIDLVIRESPVKIIVHVN